MNIFKQLSKIFLNITLLRGRRRLPRLLLLLVVCGVVFTVLRQSTCLFNPTLCRDVDMGKVYKRTQEGFEKGNKQPVNSHNIPVSTRQQPAPIPAVKADTPRGAIKLNNGDNNHPIQNVHHGVNMNKEKVDFDKELPDQKHEDISNLDDRESSPVKQVNVDEVKSPKPNINPEPVINKVHDTFDANDERKDNEEENVDSNDEKARDDPDEDTGFQGVELGEPPQQPDDNDQEAPMKKEDEDGVQGDKVETDSLKAHSNGVTIKDGSNSTAPLYDENGMPITEGESEEERLEKEREQRKKTAEWVAKMISSGEMCKTVCPPFIWSEWSPCSKACGRGRRYRKAIYEFVCQSSDLCPLNRIEESVCETPCRFNPEKYGGPGGLDLYPINPLNPPIYPESKSHMCGHWLVEYEKLHNEIVTGKRSPAYLIYTTGDGVYPTAGGLSARIKGITTVFFMAVLLERAFLIEWTDPPGLEDYLVPKSFNWADLTPIKKLKRGPMQDIGSWRAVKEAGKSSQWYMNTNFSTFFKNPVEVVQGHRYDFTYAVLRNPELMPKAYELGIDRVKCRICCAWDMLFKMTEKFEKEMNELLKTLGAPGRPITAIQARTKQDDVQKAVTTAEGFINCAQRAVKDLKIKNSALIPIFNNRLVVHIISKKFVHNMKTPINIDTATRTVHTHLGNLPTDTELEVAKGVQERTFKEFFVMLNSTLLVRAKGYLGSFGNVADAIRRHYAMHDKEKIYTYISGGSACALFEDNTKIE